MSWVVGLELMRVGAGTQITGSELASSVTASCVTGKAIVPPCAFISHLQDGIVLRILCVKHAELESKH